MNSNVVPLIPDPIRYGFRGWSNSDLKLKRCELMIRLIEERDIGRRVRLQQVIAAIVGELTYREAKYRLNTNQRDPEGIC